MGTDVLLKRKRRKLSIRNKLRGTKERPRLSVFRSSSNLYAQIIDDDKQVTLCSASTLEASIKGTSGNKCNIENAKKIGSLLSERALKANIKKIVFDRNGYKYHGRIKAIADACREAGLIF